MANKTSEHFFTKEMQVSKIEWVNYPKEHKTNENK